MDALYRLGSAPAADIRDAIPNPPSNTAVRTLLTILQEKGHISSRREGMRYIYEPTVSKDEVAQTTIQTVVDTFFGGSIERVVATLVNSKESTLTEEQIENLKAIIENARSNER